MKKTLLTILIFVLLFGAGFGGYWLFSVLTTANKATVSEIVENDKIQTNNSNNINTEKPNGSSESLVSLEKVIEVTPDDKYSYGAFCRVGYAAERNEFLVTFGGANALVQQEFSDSYVRPGGAEGGNGYSYKYYSVDDFEYTGENGVVINAGGDSASVMVDDKYYYLLSGKVPEIKTVGEWMITEFNANTMEQVNQVAIDIDTDYDILSDQMLAYANNFLIASSLYVAEGTNQDRKLVNSTKGEGTHNHLFTKDLVPVDFFRLSDTPHSNGGYVVYQNEIYNYITSTGFFGDLIVMQYDKNWKYLGVKKLGVYGTWAQGAVYDEATERFYVAYVGLEKHDQNYNAQGINLGIYDKNWNLIETVEVSGSAKKDNTREFRPSVILHEDKLYVSYDTSPGDEDQKWQCLVSIYNLK